VDPNATGIDHIGATNSTNYFGMTRWSSNFTPTWESDRHTTRHFHNVVTAPFCTNVN